MIFCLNSISLNAQWVYRAGTDVCTHLGANGGATVTNSDIYEGVYGYCKVMVCDGSAPGLYYDYHSLQGVVAFHNSNNSNNIVSPDVILLEDPSLNVPMRALVVYYDPNNGQVIFEDYVWAGNPGQFYYNAEYKVTETIINCVHIDGDNSGNFVAVWDAYYTDTGGNPSSEIRIQTGYLNFSNWLINYQSTVRRLYGSWDFTWPDVALYSTDPTQTNHASPNDSVLFTWSRNSQKAISYKVNTLVSLFLLNIEYWHTQ